MCIHTYVITLFMLYLVAKYLNRVLTFAVSWYSAAFLNTKLSSFFLEYYPLEHDIIPTIKFKENLAIKM